MASRPVELTDVSHGGRKSRLRLLAPLRYLQISHPEKLKYDFIVPIAGGLILSAAWLMAAPSLAIFGENGVLRAIRELLSIAVPFAIGALATVAMAGPDGKLDRRPAGAELVLDGQVLTLRQFVCWLLGYLSFLSIVTLVGVIIAELIKPIVLSWLMQSPVGLLSVRRIGIVTLSLMICFLAATTLWSLYFLTDVVSRPSQSQSDR